MPVREIHMTLQLCHTVDTNGIAISKYGKLLGIEQSPMPAAAARSKSGTQTTCHTQSTDELKGY